MTSDVSRNIEEQLSAFLDDELRAEELELLVRRLERDDEYRATLARYSLIGNVVRRDPVQTYPDQFRARIMAAIVANSTPVQAVDMEQSRAASWRIPFASAAAIALVAVGLASAGLFDAPPDTGAAKLAGLETAGRDSAAVPGPVAEPQPVRKVASQSASLQPERLSSYMVSHREYAQPLHRPIANSRLVVQQVRFEE